MSYLWLYLAFVVGIAGGALIGGWCATLKVERQELVIRRLRQQLVAATTR